MFLALAKKMMLKPFPEIKNHVCIGCVHRLWREVGKLRYLHVLSVRCLRHLNVDGKSPIRHRVHSTCLTNITELNECMVGSGVCIGAQSGLQRR